MPSYAEAEWAAGVLEDRVEKPVLLDAASDDETTQSLKDEFFAGEGRCSSRACGDADRGRRLQARPPRRGGRLWCSDRQHFEPADEGRPSGLRRRSSAASPTDSRGQAGRVSVRCGLHLRADDSRRSEGRPSAASSAVPMTSAFASCSTSATPAIAGTPSDPYLPDDDEFQPVSPDMLDVALERFRSRLASQ